MAIVMAVSAEASVRHAKAAATMPPRTISGGTAAPTCTRPMDTSSTAAPTARPVGTSPQQQTDERGANEGLLEVKTAEQAGVPHAEHADEADEHRTDERIHTLLLSVRQKPG